MKRRSTASLAAAAMLFGTLACAGNKSGGEDETAAAPQDTTQVQNPPGYSGMERDTTILPDTATAVDTFLNEQGTGVPTDTMGYGGLERPDTSGAAGQDTTGAGWSDTTSTTGVDTSGMSGMGDTTGMSGMGDTTGQSSWDSTAQQ